MICMVHMLCLDLMLSQYSARLTTTQAESDDQIMLTRLANSRRSDIQIQIEKLRSELNAATAEKEAETEKRENIIQQLKDDLATVEQVAEENTKSMLENMEIENKKIQGPDLNRNVWLIQYESYQS